MLTASRIEYAVITVQFDPVTDADHLLTRQELVSSSLAEAEQSQAELIPTLPENTRCYIQERAVHLIQYGKRATSQQGVSLPNASRTSGSFVIERHEILKVRNIWENRG